jgi:hypothetical protein
MRLRLFAALVLLLATPMLVMAGPTTKPAGATGFNKGDVAPEIVGKDVHGKAMKLSDFRNKIVVIDFFGDW